jgi:hypothetical protein
MKGLALLGILLIIYGIVVIGFVIKKPEGVWKMKKIQTFIKVLGDKGTDIAFLIFAVIAAGGGLWLLITSQ